MNSFFEQLQRLAEQVRRRQPHIRGEESTKQALIVPFLSLLGYDVHDPTELQPEYIADFAKKRPGGPSEKVDYQPVVKAGAAKLLSRRRARSWRAVAGDSRPSIAAQFAQGPAQATE